MNKRQLTNNQKILIFIFSFFGLILILSTIYILFFSNKLEKVNIKGFTSIIEDMPKDRKEAIEQSLFNVVKLNKPDITMDEIGEGSIRENSIKEQYLNNKTIKDGTFIVDLSNIQQSYRVSYRYEINPKKGQVSPYLGGQSIYVRCLPKEDLIYPDFNCKDINTEQLGDLDPLASKLPANRLDYNIKGLYDDNNKLSLRVKFNPAFNDESSQQTKNEYIALYKKSVLNWISSQGVNPDDYQISWSHDDNANPIPSFVY